MKVQKSETYSMFKELKFQLILLFLCFFYGSFAQSSLQNKIDFTVDNIAVEDALLKLSEAANIGILFPSDLFEETEKVTIRARQESIENLLKKCLANTKISYKIENGNLLLIPRPPRKLTVSGFVEDAKSGERLIAATVMDLHSGKGTTTNEYGFFSLSVIEGDCQLFISYIGYQSNTEVLKLSKNTRLILKLEPSVMLSEVIVTPVNASKNAQQNLLGKGFSVNQQQIESTPALAGETDVFRHWQLQSGIQTGTDGLGGLHVRGGATDQNLVLLDGVPVYNPSHSLGFFSIFNAPTIKSAKLLKDGFSARYGGRLSSVMDVRLKEGNNQKFSGSIGTSTMATNILIEGPILKNKIGFLLAARRSHIDPLVNYVSKKEKKEQVLGGQIDYYFYDLNAKIHVNFSPTDRVFLSFYKGEDHFEDKNIIFDEFYDFYYPSDLVYFDDSQWGQKLDWGNEITSLRWNHLFGEKLFANATATFSKFKYNSQNYGDYYFEYYGVVEQDDIYYSRFQSIMEDKGIKVDFDYFPSDEHHITFGAGILSRDFKPGFGQFQGDVIVEFDDFTEVSEFVKESYPPIASSAIEYNGYVEDKLTIGSTLAASVGLYAAYFKGDGKNYWSLQPRIHLLWAPSKTLRMSLSGSKMTQFMHVLTTSGSGFPSEMWVPSTARVKPQDAYQIAATVEQQLTDDWSLSIGGYYKQLKNLTAYKEDTLTLPSLSDIDPFIWEEEITSGTGENYGVELALAKKQGKITGALAYTWSKAFRQFDVLNQGKQFPFRYHHDHALNVHLTYQLNKLISFQSLFEYGSGQNITLVKTDENFSILDNALPWEIDLLSSNNGFKLPAYHRLDLMMKLDWTKNKWHHQISLGAYNVYNRKNAQFVYELDDWFAPENSGRKQKNGLPILPTIGYQVTWN